MLNCVCNDDVCGSEFSSVSIRTARKVHRCGECHATIQPGDRYEYVIGKYEDGKFWVAKTCMICKRIRDDLLPCGWYYGEIWDDIHRANCYGDASDGSDDFCICPVST